VCTAMVCTRATSDRFCPICQYRLTGMLARAPAVLVLRWHCPGSI
jgi:hypothetical protein